MAGTNHQLYSDRWFITGWLWVLGMAFEPTQLRNRSGCESCRICCKLPVQKMANKNRDAFKYMDIQVLLSLKYLNPVGHNRPAVSEQDIVWNYRIYQHPVKTSSTTKRYKSDTHLPIEGGAQLLLLIMFWLHIFRPEERQNLPSGKLTVCCLKWP